ncbi:hypothetical protein AB5I41_12340 [Sphingomonas sp. MMS24-JH45]
MALTGGLVFGQSVYPLLFLPMLVQIGVTYGLRQLRGRGGGGDRRRDRIGRGGAEAGTAERCSLHDNSASTLLFLQIYLLALLASALPLAALLAKREDLMRQLRFAHAEAAHAALPRQCGGGHRRPRRAGGPDVAS